MKTEKEKWVDQVFDSVKAPNRAQPDPTLLARIENSIQQPKAKVLTMSQWRIAVAAAILLLVLNVIGVRQYLQNDPSDTQALAIEETQEAIYLSNYQLYE